MIFRLQRRPLARRRILKSFAATSLMAVSGGRAAFRPLPQHKATLAIAAIQASAAGAEGNPHANLAAMLALLDKVQAYGGQKDICLFPAMALSLDATTALRLAARRHGCTLVFGTRGRDGDGRAVGLMTTITPIGQVRLESYPEDFSVDGISVLALRTPHGAFRAVACAAEAGYPTKLGCGTAIYDPAGQVIVATRSRAEQAVSAVVAMDSPADGLIF